MVRFRVDRAGQIEVTPLKFLTTGAGLSWTYLQNWRTEVVAALIFSTRPFLNRRKEADSYVEHSRLYIS